MPEIKEKEGHSPRDSADFCKVQEAGFRRFHQIHF